MTLLATLATAAAIAAPLSDPASTTGHQNVAATKRAICAVFGRYCGQALRVAACESGFNVYARSPGGHLGLFQFGAYARARYGFGWNAWTQSRAAYRYFADSSFRWTAWSCKP